MNATTVREGLLAAGDRLFVERAALRRLAQWAPPEATVDELLVGLGVVRPRLRNAVWRRCRDEPPPDDTELASILLGSEELVHGAVRLWSAWANAAYAAAVAKHDQSRAAGSVSEEERDAAAVEAEWCVDLAVRLVLELAILCRLPAVADDATLRSARPTAPVPEPSAKQLLRQLSYARGAAGDLAAPMLSELADRTPDDLPPRGVLAGLVITEPVLGMAAHALLGRELPTRLKAYEVVDALDLWRLWRVSLRHDLEGVGAGPGRVMIRPGTRSLVLQEVLTSVEQGLGVLERLDVAGEGETIALSDPSDAAGAAGDGGDAGDADGATDLLKLAARSAMDRLAASQQPCSCGRPLKSPYRASAVIETMPDVWRHPECAAREARAVAARVVHALIDAGLERLADAMAGETRAAASCVEVEDAVGRLLTLGEIRTLLPRDLWPVPPGSSPLQG